MKTLGIVFFVIGITQNNPAFIGIGVMWMIIGD